MKKITMLALLGFLLTMVITSADAADRKAPKRKTGDAVPEKSTEEEPKFVRCNALVGDELLARVGLPSEGTSHARVGRGRGKQQPQAVAEAASAVLPAPSVMRSVEADEAAASSAAASSGAWKSRRITKDDLQAIIDAWPEKQRTVMNYLIEHGFSPLAAAYFVALDEENVFELLKGDAEEVDTEQIAEMLVAPAFRATHADLQLLSFVMHLPSFLCGAIGHTPEELMKWLLVRTAMWTASKDATGMHIVMLSGMVSFFESMPQDVAAGIITEVDKARSSLSLSECAFKSQSKAAVDWCVTQELITKRVAADRFKENTFEEDSEALVEWAKAQAFNPATLRSVMGAVTKSGMGSMLGAALNPMAGLFKGWFGGSASDGKR